MNNYNSVARAWDEIVVAPVRADEKAKNIRLKTEADISNHRLKLSAQGLDSLANVHPATLIRSGVEKFRPTLDRGKVPTATTGGY